jgi:hypothetical protein
MSDPPLKEGRITVEWRLLPEPFVATSGAASAFAWDLSFDPPGLPDEKAAELLREIADRV